MPAPTYTDDAVTDRYSEAAWTLEDCGTVRYILLDPLSEYEVIHNGIQKDGTTADLNAVKMAMTIAADVTPVPSFGAGSKVMPLPAGSSRIIRKTTTLAVQSAAGNPTVTIVFIKKNDGLE